MIEMQDTFIPLIACTGLVAVMLWCLGSMARELMRGRFIDTAMYWGLWIMLTAAVSGACMTWWRMVNQVFDGVGS